jgi:glycosyltransferase involved in cell wall biosynthesis
MKSEENVGLRILQVAATSVTVEKLLLPLIDALLAQGHNVDIACANGKHADALITRNYNILIFPFKRALLSPSHALSFWQLFWHLKKTRYDVVHFHTPMVSLIGRIAAKLAGESVIIYTAHGFYFHDQMNQLLRGIIVLIEKILARWATDWLFLQSMEDMEIAKEKRFLIDETHMVWIGNGVNKDAFLAKYDIEGKRKEIGLKKNDKVIAFIGRIVKEKGIVELVEAFAEIKSSQPIAKLLVIGEALESDRDRSTYIKIQSFVKNAGMQNEVLFLGFRNDIPELLAASDIFALPSYREGMPRTIIEAMMSGKPVITSDIRGCREEVVNKETGFLVESRDVNSINKALGKLLSNEELVMEMGEKGRERALALYDEEIIINRQVSIYDTIKQSK